MRRRFAATGFVGTGSLSRFSGSPSCTAFGTSSADVYCTDFSGTTNYASGERYYTYTLPLGGTYIVGLYNSAWLPLAIGGNGLWQVTNKVRLNTRPDADNTPVNSNNWDECGSVCAPSLPTFTYTFTALNYYPVVLQIEDHYTSSSSSWPMSSVPTQFLLYSTAAPSGCSTPPAIPGVRPHLAQTTSLSGDLDELLPSFLRSRCPGQRDDRRSSRLPGQNHSRVHHQLADRPEQECHLQSQHR